MRLRPGDVLEYVVTASDPVEEPILCRCQFLVGIGGPMLGDKWSEENTFTFEVTDQCVGKNFFAYIEIKSNRKYHARRDCDDLVVFEYEVLPPK
jgi:hypothetical protein